MKERLIGFLKTYFLFVCIFALQKPFFMLFYRPLYEGVSWTEWLGVMWHGLPLDLSLAGYLTAIPGLLFICSAWAVPNLPAVYGAVTLSSFPFYSLLYLPSIWACTNTGDSGWTPPLCFISFLRPKMRWQASVSGW